MAGTPVLPKATRVGPQSAQIGSFDYFVGVAPFNGKRTINYDLPGRVAKPIAVCWRLVKFYTRRPTALSGRRSRPTSRAKVAATSIMVNAAPEKMSPRSVRPKIATGSVTQPGG